MKECRNNEASRGTVAVVAGHQNLYLLKTKVLCDRREKNIRESNGRDDNVMVESQL
jgi:hypothetical protein